MTRPHGPRGLFDPLPLPRTTDGNVHPVTVRHATPKPAVR